MVGQSKANWLRVGPVSVALVVNIVVFVALTLIRRGRDFRQTGVVAAHPCTAATVDSPASISCMSSLPVGVMFFFGGALERLVGSVHLLAIIC